MSETRFFYDNLKADYPEVLERIDGHDEETVCEYLRKHHVEYLGRLLADGLKESGTFDEPA